MITKIKHILIGWGKRFGWLPTSEAEIKLSELRMRKCSTCNHARESMMLLLIEGEGQYEKTLKCSLCGGCPCKIKSTVVAEMCPDGRW